MANHDSVDVRSARSSDADAIRSIYYDIVSKTVISFEEEAPSLEEIVRRMSLRPRLPWFVAESDGRVVGYAYASQHRLRAADRWSADCSVYVADAHRGHGVGRLLYERLIAEVRGLGYVSLFAGIAVPNPPSVQLHESLGFRPVGVFTNVGFKQGEWRDVGWWMLPLTATPPLDPGEPREWNVVG